MKLKLFMIIALGITSFCYNIINSDFLKFIQTIDYSLLIYSHIGYKSSDSYFGMIFDLLISLFFNINIRDINSFFKIFGGWMKKFAYIFLVLCALFIGMEIGVLSNDTKTRELDERIDEFERQITDPNNNYQPGQDNQKVNPNITNNLAKTGEKAITSFFDYTLGIIESLVKK